MMGDLLNAVVAAARRSGDERERRVSRGHLESRIRRRPIGDAFRASLSASGVRVIAECKRRSPSRGVLMPVYDPASIAAAYERGGAAAISVLTEPTFFDGSLDHLAQVRARVALPVLRKDFIVTDYQVVEAAVYGADAVLLIVAALSDAELVRLMTVAADLSLASLVEVHDRDELARALSAGAGVIGVNSRNLRTLQVDPRVLDDVGALIPPDVVAVAESGLKHASELQRLADVRYDAFLIGERLMMAPDPVAALGDLGVVATAVSE